MEFQQNFELLFIVVWLNTDTTRLRRWLSRAWQATHKGMQDADEIGAVEMGKAFAWIKHLSCSNSVSAGNGSMLSE